MNKQKTSIFFCTLGEIRMWMLSFKYDCLSHVWESEAMCYLFVYVTWKFARPYIFCVIGLSYVFVDIHLSIETVRSSSGSSSSNNKQLMIILWQTGTRFVGWLHCDNRSAAHLSTRHSLLLLVLACFGCHLTLEKVYILTVFFVIYRRRSQQIE